MGGGGSIDYQHLPAVSVRSRIPDNVWNNYFKFCFEREPLDKVVSKFKFTNQRNNKNISFREFIELGDFPYNYPFYTDFSGNIIVDYIGRYENIDAEMEYICNRIGIPYHCLPKKNVSKDKTDYKEFYNTKQKSEVEKKFIREINLFKSRS